VHEPNSAHLKAHARFEELDERRALDYLGLASLLMRRLDDASLNEAEAQPERLPEDYR
jgi:hypothetical protein